MILTGGSGPVLLTVMPTKGGPAEVLSEGAVGAPQMLLSAFTERSTALPERKVRIVRNVGKERLSSLNCPGVGTH